MRDSEEAAKFAVLIYEAVVDVTNSPNSVANSPVDMDDLLNRCLGRMSIAERILQRFQTAIDEEISRLSQALHVADAQELTQVAHRIKGAALAVSAYELSEIASKIERNAKVQNLKEIPPLTLQLQESCRAIREYLVTVSSNIQPNPPSGER